MKKARLLAKEPEHLIPDCDEDCKRCDFDRVLAKLKRIQAFKNNVKFLQRFAKTGTQMERAYAVMLVLSNEEKAPFLGVAKLPGGEVSYAQRGKVKKEVLIGVQHFDDPRFNILAYSEIALKKRLNLYSTHDGIICTGMRARYPKKLVADVLQGTDYQFRRDGDKYLCPTSQKDEVGARLNIEIISAGLSVSLWGNAASEKENIYTALAGKVMSKNVDADFHLSLDFFLKCESSNCSIGTMDIRTKALLKDYMTGRFSDKALMDAYMQEARAQMKNINKRLLVVSGRCYEDDLPAFIDALKPSKIERLALERVLETVHRPVIVDSATASSVLSQFWEDLGEVAIDAVVNDKALAKEIYAKNRDSGKPPSHVLRLAKNVRDSKDILARLPKLTGLPPIAAFADNISRVYRVDGKAETVRELEKAQKGDTKTKAIACGLLLAIDSLKGKEWLFTKEELDYGKYLGEFCKSLLECDEKLYKEALQNLLTASGSGVVV